MVIFRHKKGQLSIELVLLMSAVVLGGSVVGYTMLKNPSFNGTHIDGVKKVSFSGFVENTPSVVDSGGGSYNITNTTNTTSTNNTSDNSTTNTDSNNTNINDTTNDTTNDTNPTANDSEVQFPDLVPVNISIVSMNGTEISHCWRERVQNGGEDHKLTNQFRHKCGKCDNDTTTMINVLIENDGNANVTKPFKVALYDNGEKVGETTPVQSGNLWMATFEYKISTSRCGNHHQYQNGGENHQQRYMFHGRNCTADNHTLKAVVDCNNDILESNESNNEISTDIGVMVPVHQCNGHCGGNSIHTADQNSADDLYIDISGGAGGLLTKNILAGGKYISGDISLTTNGYSNYEYNANGTVHGNIYVTGSAKYNLGNLQKIESLQAYIAQGGSLDVGVPEIGTFKIMKNKKGKNSEIGGGVYLKVHDSSIGTFYVHKITSGAVLDFKNFSIDTFETDDGAFGGGAGTTFTDGKISTMKFGNINEGGASTFENMIIGDITINDMSGGPTLNFENTTINSMKMNKLTGNPTIYLEHSSNLNYLEANKLSGSDIEVKDGSSLKEIKILGSTGTNGNIYVEDGGKINKLSIDGKVNALISMDGVIGLTSVDIGNIGKSGRMDINNVLGTSVKTGSVSGSINIEDSTLSSVDIKGVSNSGHATIKNSNIDNLHVDSLPDWGSKMEVENCNITELNYGSIGNGYLIIKNSNIKTLTGSNLNNLIKNGHISITNSKINGKNYN
jgi:hypothetical protein